MIDVTKLTMEERRELLWALLPDWAGPLALPGTGDDRRTLAVLPLCSNGLVAPRTNAEVVRCVNVPFRPHRLVIADVPLIVERREPGVAPPRRWWQRRAPRPGPDRVTVEHATLGRRFWSVDSFFVGDAPAWLAHGAVSGDLFAPDGSFDLDCRMAQLGQVVSLRVFHEGPAPAPFRAVLVGTTMRREAAPFVPVGGPLRSIEDAEGVDPS